MEFIWVVPREAVLGPDGLHGFLPLSADAMESQFLAPARDQGFFVERRWAESQPTFKQPIPYVAVCQAGKVLCLTRLATQGEKRLHGRRSIGVGGHINPCDMPTEGSPGGTDLFARACQRELEEELSFSSPPTALTPLGILNDDTTEVGSVHLGLVYRLDIPADNETTVQVRETDAMLGSFECLADLERLADAEDDPFETWSSLLLSSGALREAFAPLS